MVGRSTVWGPALQPASRLPSSAYSGHVLRVASPLPTMVQEWPWRKWPVPLGAAHIPTVHPGPSESPLPWGHSVRYVARSLQTLERPSKKPKF